MNVWFFGWRIREKPLVSGWVLYQRGKVSVLVLWQGQGQGAGAGGRGRGRGSQDSLRSELRR